MEHACAEGRGSKVNSSLLVVFIKYSLLFTYAACVHSHVYMFTQHHHNSTGQTHCVLVFSAAVEKIQQQFQSHNITTVHTTMSER